MKLLILQFSGAFRHFLPLKSKHFLDCHCYKKLNNKYIKINSAATRRVFCSYQMPVTQRSGPSNSDGTS